MHLNWGGTLCGICFVNDENVTLPCDKKACDECVRRVIKNEVLSYPHTVVTGTSLVNVSPSE